MNLARFRPPPIVLAAAMAAVLAGARAAPAAAGFAEAVEAYDQGDYATTFAESLPLARAGDADAQAMLGYLYARGEGIGRDPVAAYFWYALAARQGDPFAAEAAAALARTLTPAERASAEARLRAWSPSAE